MDVLMLSRLQFAMATMFHFIFVPLTLGLSILVAIMETKYVRTGDETYKRMTKFWGKLFVINFVLGVVTGITLEFQFGTNWSRYSEYVGDIFGSLLAIEATTSFFLESTFLGAWIFGWNILSPKMHAACIWLVAIASNLSAAWILLANAFMQNPVGYVLRNGRAELDNFFQVLLNPFGWQQYVHTLSGAFTLAGFFLMGVSAYHLLKKQNIDFFTRSFKMGMVFALVFSALVALQGHHHAQEVGRIQPAKLAAMESLWETQESAPMYLLVVPDEKNEKNAIELFGIPGGLSFLAHGSFTTPVQGLKDWPADERPPVMLTFLSFRAMVGIGTLLPILCIWAFLRRNKLTETPRLLKAMLFAIPLPYLAIEAGWVVAEVGRQPWIVYGLMKTADAVSPIVTSQVAFSLVALTLLYALLGAVDIYLLFKFAKKGPAEA
ncbi:cytochrome ubiquinol oxidase subunit I [Desulfomicrobium baculatum]|uniref:Cytochrome bd ubiquinol oxidase subunit I n=1 Tax=Desulfomicrobium baculatum (strain DSM 4028 / VKM B-1378 / X) TaxID=525897 RepID=C7LS49_DESBD|nr:cytochrome ubiquinol oxidase subunit I [Desulfomicrobium baculatum]ACU90597.1 cytochrome bd ubiquinol oxidase subunit I [Desulfomicrobium baculatum DSM 4028]